MALELYSDLLSQPCRALAIFLRVLGVPYTTRKTSLLEGEHKSAEYARINPMQSIPAMVEEGFVLTESVAIIKYLAARYNAPDHWYPADVRRRAKVDEYLAWHHLQTRRHAMKVFILEGLLPKLTGLPVEEEKLATALAELVEVLDKLETMFLGDRNFLCGDDISIADLMAVCELMQPLGASRDIFQDRPRLREWKLRVKEAVGKPLFEEVHREILGLPDATGPFPRSAALQGFAKKVVGGDA
ncbi:glutathione S-transferase theta-1 [Latimeria chalumnae]|uniref:glutathione transferase n=1 Tax=Latimeria chalumnae TaxID=7897 RepID=H3AT62_LATCH|nr:PREDICTED: glutathione S-transferase theta-1-like [Latimeria chalumnae]XP_014344710.1 PREDICTED: glutathione S-transferase theta-1-like [Latimeria chalumnae]XP_014344714.1 PREDICTED: glutathione S-transferase theta-1-like [Latimeria chalumnae]XP_014344717.1 PREDICTED: glutathione S-transferase theta-1-like [Latimeria chalumnae]XP_014344719.1 PREDICTED: glutathione S-transferase theta-1-like [Latimeria chalumnae]|eukprot:XP_005987166.1 PREDICTED: glutathione S-transferase theta-1-like [Latimeria chalumnae]